MQRPLKLATHQKTGQQYLVWQLFRRPNHGWTFYPANARENVVFLARDGSPSIREAVLPGAAMAAATS